MEKAHPPSLRGVRIRREMNAKLLENVVAASKYPGRLFPQRCRRARYHSGIDRDAIWTRIYQTIEYKRDKALHTHDRRRGFTLSRLQSFHDGVDLSDHLRLPQVTIRMCLRNRHLLPLSQRNLLHTLLDVEAHVNSLCIWESSLAVVGYLLAVGSNLLEGVDDVERNASSKDRRRWNADSIDPTCTDADDASDLSIGPEIVSFG